ncbi:MAG: 1-deoxy-D-xylulose-5-phosphate reductoisomerase [Rhodobacteraceae bacterium]|nr:1-deoxy-D-xylulose-5-phosphate reductoisomerase [Paracoccaceae bacterium]
MKRVSIFGATGSIGCSTIDLIAREPGRYRVVALTGGRNVAKLAEQARALGAELAVTAHPECYGALREALAGSRVEVAAGPEAVVEAAARPADWTMSAIVGAAGLAPGLKALQQGRTLALANKESLQQGRTLALANKESLVTAGPLLLDAARASGATVLPVDSEHSAVFQALVGEDMAAVERVIITASGGAFRDWPAEKLATATLAEASSHPNWNMGQRITIDSASLFNKALELIETKEYFGIAAPDRIEAVIHPESIVHALVGFTDGALMAHLGPPDMRHAIGYALHWPERRHVPVERLDLAKVAKLTFRAPDEARYPALRLAREVMAAGGLSGAVFNAAKERALDAFIAGEIGFLDMAAVVEEVLSEMIGAGHINVEFSLDNVVAVDHLARDMAARTIVQRRQA